MTQQVGDVFWRATPQLRCADHSKPTLIEDFKGVSAIGQGAAPTHEFRADRDRPTVRADRHRRPEVL